MTAPLRRHLLNHEIAIEARRIAHEGTFTCKGEFNGTDHNDEHNRRCNALKREIENLAMAIKLAGLQRSIRNEQGNGTVRTREGDSHPRGLRVDREGQGG
jgi:hypothetical protein